MDWTKVRFFCADEFDSPDEPESGSRMQAALVMKLDTLRETTNYPLKINSGYRTERHNAIVGGKPNSAHLRGLAADLAAPDLQGTIRLAIMASRIGFKRIGVDLKGKFIHVDVDDSLPTPATWFYS